MASAAPTAKVTGPVADGEQGAPFSAPVVDLADYGYVVEEFFLEGSASAYRLKSGSEHSEDGKWAPSAKKNRCRIAHESSSCARLRQEISTARSWCIGKMSRRATSWVRCLTANTCEAMPGSVFRRNPWE